MENNELQLQQEELVETEETGSYTESPDQVPQNRTESSWSLGDLSNSPTHENRISEFYPSRAGSERRSSRSRISTTGDVSSKDLYRHPFPMPSRAGSERRSSRSRISFNFDCSTTGDISSYRHPFPMLSEREIREASDTKTIFDQEPGFSERSSSLERLSPEPEHDENSFQERYEYSKGQIIYSWLLLLYVVYFVTGLSLLLWRYFYVSYCLKSESSKILKFAFIFSLFIPFSYLPIIATRKILIWVYDLFTKYTNPSNENLD